MGDELKTCIYCRTQDQTRFKGVEHVVPQSFGRFGSETPTLQCVCDDCNGEFGKTLDAYLARETVEGVVRYNHGILSTEARPQKHLHIALDDVPEAGQFAGMKVAIDGSKGELMPPLAQFQILNQKTGRTETYFKKQIEGLSLPEDQYGRPGDRSESGTWKCAIFGVSKADHDEIVEALRANGIAFVPGEPFEAPTSAAGENQTFEPISLPVVITGEVTLTHRRAHAKILMNFIAKYLGMDEALKPHWDFLRDFARGKMEPIKYKVLEDPFPVGQDSEALKIIRNSITIRIENLGGNVVGSLQFYGNQIYQYLLREKASLPEEQQLGYLYMAGEKPRPLFKMRI
jgi:hypothetical protein